MAGSSERPSARSSGGLSFRANGDVNFLSTAKFFLWSAAHAQHPRRPVTMTVIVACYTTLLDEVSSHVRLDLRPPDRLFHLVLESHDGRAPGADSEEKHEPVSDIDTVVVDSLKAA